ncbi:MAG: hypothetical protein PVI06_00535 [Desulfobacterales bacterium]|jgi:hypothetical protein
MYQKIESNPELAFSGNFVFGVSQRALFVIDKKGIIRATHVADINRRPDLEW